MSLMERRLQLLLDRHRFRLVESEAERSGRSVAAVIREAIDLRFADDDAAARRADAAGELLRRMQDNSDEQPYDPRDFDEDAYYGRRPR